MPPVASTLHRSLQYVPLARGVNCLSCAALIKRCSRAPYRPKQSAFFSTRRLSTSITDAQSALHGLRDRSKNQRTLVFQSTSDNPFHNLAIEHFLLTNSDVHSRILLFYTDRPCVVIGRNQNPWTECNLKLIQDGIGGEPIDLVRRRSGGGTVFHDRGNLNFSVIVPNDHDFTRKKHSEMVVRALNEIHIVSAEYDGPESVWVNDRHDITMATMHNKGRTEFKVSGSAYKLTRGRALHHGTLLHSSPNLENISRFLNPPGKEWIQAKGVESVRSPVMNIFNVRDDTERDRLRSQVIHEITQQFLKLYNANAEVELVGDRDCRPDVNHDIAKGVDELRSDAWRFDQTPRSEFASKIVGGNQVTFNIRNGLLEEARVGPPWLPVSQRLALKGRQPQQKLHEIRDWCDVFEPNTVDGELLATIAQVFPDVHNFLCPSLTGVNTSGGSVENRKDATVRRHPDGTIEKEIGLNTIQESKI